jgi:hypothetical protein
MGVGGSMNLCRHNRARTALQGRFSERSSWSASFPATKGARRAAYERTGKQPMASLFALDQESYGRSDAQLIA